MTRRSSWTLCMILVSVAASWLAGASPLAAQTASNDVIAFWMLRYGIVKLATPIQSEDVLLGRYEKTFDVKRLAKAQPDEWFYSIAGKNQVPRDPRTPIDPGDPTNKVNQAYVWGMTKVGDKLWFGTVPNTACLVAGTYFRGLLLPGVAAGGFQVCEYNRSFFSATNVPGGMQVAPEIGDWRPPQIYTYDTKANVLKRIDPELPPEGSNAVWNTLGFRSATTHRGIVFMGGPSIEMGGGINLFAFDGQTGQFLGVRNLPKYGNIRKWLAVNDVLYAAVAASSPDMGDFAPGGGWVLRWLDDPNHPDYPFSFEEVGVLDGGGADLCLHEGRLFVNTWPSFLGTSYPPTQIAIAGLWMSPPIPAGGLRTVHAGLWEKVWQTDEYEPDPVTAQGYGMGAMASFGGWLFWGTMHTPLTSQLLHALNYGGLVNGSLNQLERNQGVLRPSMVFRGRNFFGGGNPQIQLLYGMAELPAYNAADARWEIVPNNMGVYPRFGLAGFGNLYNDYIWTMSVFKDHLYVGTHDAGVPTYQPYVDSKTNLQQTLLQFLTAGILDTSKVTYVQAELSDPGADLYRFISPNLPALQVSKSGLRNYSTYGIRTMINDGTSMYLGMANPRNLWTNPNDEYPEGGWELWRIRRKTLGGAKDETPVVRPGSAGSKSKTPASRR